MEALRHFLCLCLFLSFLVRGASAQTKWIAPTPEELHMTSIPEVPGADAVILNTEETDDDDLHMRAIYFRIKILSESGVRRGDVELQFDRRSDGNGFQVASIEGRTIQPDGTVVPFTGKPYDKLLHKDKENAYTARVFSLPAVQVGSIIEYRYFMRWDDRIFYRPYWQVQTDLFLRKGHYHWRPTGKELISTTRGGRENLASRITWAQSLPKGTEVKMMRLPTQRLDIDLNVENVLPFSREEYMPPVRSSRYHVVFYYTPYRTAEEYWKSEIKFWSSDTDRFMRVTAAVQAEAQAATAGVSGEEEKARRLYAAVMAYENTDFTRSHQREEDGGETRSAEDVVKRKRGSGDQIAMTYVALARAAGLQASAMIVADRENILMDVNWMNFSEQLTDTVAIVRYGGTEHFLDPGSRYTPFGHLAWNHTLCGGVRQGPVDRQKLFQQTPGDGFRYSHTSRVGDLKLEADGHMTGTVTLTYEGSPALRWRQTALRSDATEVRKQLKEEIESLLPAETQVNLVTVGDLANGELPLKVMAAVDGHVGRGVGSHVMLPNALFENNSRPTFTHERRDQPVYFPYPELVQDAVRFKLPSQFSVEAPPQNKITKLGSVAAYSLTAAQSENAITLRRDLIQGDIYFPVDQYGALRTFYNTFEHEDHGSFALKRVSGGTAQP